MGRKNNKKKGGRVVVDSNMGGNQGGARTQGIYIYVSP